MGLEMNVSDIRFPRQLEADYGRDAIRRVLTDRTAKLWPGGDLNVPVIPMTDALKNAMQAAFFRGQIRLGLEGVTDKLKNEEAGIENLRSRAESHGERISRLILFSNDGAERFYRHVEQLLKAYASRLFGCLLEADSLTLGKLITGQERQIKVVMAQHKDAVSLILRAIVSGSISAGTVEPGADR